MVEVAIQDESKFGSVLGYVYFFISLTDFYGKPILDQGAHQKLVNYNFNLTKVDEKTGSSDYFNVYQFHCLNPKDIHQCYDVNMNPEDSLIKTEHYQRHYLSNW